METILLKKNRDWQDLMFIGLERKLQLDVEYIKEKLSSQVILNKIIKARITILEYLRNFSFYTDQSS